MAFYACADRTASISGTLPGCELQAAGVPLAIREVGLWSTAAGNTALQLAFCATQGTITTATGIDTQDPADGASTAAAGIAWSANPTVGAGLRVVNTPTTQLDGIVWTFGHRELLVPVNTSIGIFCTGGTAGAFDFWFVWEE